MPGDGLVLSFPRATMLTFASAVGKLNLRVLWQRHTLLHVMTKLPSNFREILEFFFEKINIEYAPHEKSQKSRRFFAERVSFRH